VGPAPLGLPALDQKSCVCEHVFVDNPNHKGNVAELAIAKEAASLGLSVLMPITEHERYDLVLGIAGRLLRVQCKWANKKGDVVVIKLSSSRRVAGGYVRRRYSAEEVDAIGAYCAEIDCCYLIPIEEVADQWMVQLRLAPTRNGQRAALHFADEYRLGAVAQLEERVDGIDEAEGSSPSSSTSHDSSGEPPSEEVGAHQFRNHFGLYMERAAAGTEILVRRRGRPYARLGPAPPPEPAPAPS
jgi:prevent-host-death family protein